MKIVFSPKNIATEYPTLISQIMEETNILRGYIEQNLNEMGLNHAMVHISKKGQKEFTYNIRYRDVKNGTIYGNEQIENLSSNDLTKFLKEQI